MTDLTPVQIEAAQPPGGARMGRLAHRQKQPQDTAEGCRARALDDLLRAGAATGGHSRATLEQSAAAWTARADLLQRLEASFQARLPGKRP